MQFTIISFKNILIKLLLIISFPCFTLLFSRNSNQSIVIISLILSLIIGFIVVTKFFDKLFKKLNYKLFFLSFIIADIILDIYYQFRLSDSLSFAFFKISNNLLPLIIMGSFIFCITLIYFLIVNLRKPIISFFKRLDGFERKYLIIFSVLFFIISIFICLKTSVFYYVENIQWDLIYTTDSSDIYKNETYLNVNSPHSDAGKQPLFGVFALPFGFVSFVLSKLLFFIPNSYPVCILTVQFILLLITIIMLEKLLKLDDLDKKGFCFLFLSLFSTLVFAFTLEQYIISLFYLVLVFYVYYNMKGNCNYAYISGATTLTTTGILLPFISKDKHLKNYLLSVLKCLLLFLAITIVFGQLSFIISFFETVLNNLNEFAGDKVLFVDRLKQYLNFVRGIFLAVPSKIVDADVSDFWYAQYLLEDVYNFSKFGILILLFCLISVIINRKNKMALISGFWVLYSFVILCLVGFGTQENGLILYSLYFSWSFIVLLYLLFMKIVRKPLVRFSVCVVVFALLLYVNVPRLYDIIDFGIMFYPN